MSAGKGSGLYRRLVFLIGGVALLILLAAMFILRSTTSDAAASQVARNLRAQVVLVDALISGPGTKPEDADSVLAGIGFRRLNAEPGGRFPHARFWDGVASELGAMLPGRQVRFIALGEPMMWVQQGGSEDNWIGFPVAPLRSEVARSVIITVIAAIIIVLIAAAAYARSLTRPLRQLAEAAPEIAEGRSAAPLHASAAREFRELEAALNAAAKVVRQTANDRALMLAALSHDMRTPLARLRLASELGPIDASLRDGMHLDIEELDHLIGQCIDFARDGRDEPVERFDMAALLGDLVATQQRSGREWTIEAPPVAMIVGRPMAMRRALTNLMENAVHHGREPFAIECGLDAGRMSVAILDRGDGVDSVILEKLGTPFMQAEASRKAGRSGLGLASALRVAAQHGGSIRFSNRDDGGFTAAMSIPLTTSRSGS
jgi:two-component system, OmpR family, osmolarity sensor histidine kinase EnvZ